MAAKKAKSLHGQRSQEFESALAKMDAELRGTKKRKVDTTFVLPVAKHIIEWTAGAQFLNFPGVFDHWGQYQLLRDITQIRCPVCNPFDPYSEGPGNCWGKSRAELEKEVLLVRSFDSPGGYICPRCKGTKGEFVDDGLLKDYNSILACLGMRSGKSYTAGLYATYLEHVIATEAQFERDALVKKLGQGQGTTLEIAFVATTSEQTEKTTWDYFRNFRERAPWTKAYVQQVKALEKAQPKTGLQPWRYAETDKEIKNELLGVKFVSLHSNSAGMAGATRLAAFVDELARFDTSESKRGATEVWRVLSASLKTVRSAAVVRNLPKAIYGLRLATSSPISVDDKMTRMVTQVETAPEELDHIFAIKKATWEFSPFQPRHLFDEEYAEDSVQAERDFGANPPLTEMPYLDDIVRFSKSIEPALTPAVEFNPTFPTDTLGREYVGIEVADAIISPEIPRFLCFDAGSNFDAFAGAMGHPGWIDVLPEPDDPDQRPRRLLLTIYDFVFRILPTEKPKRTVWFDSVAKIISHLKDHFRITKVTFDRWNSLSLIQSIRNLGVDADQSSIVAPDFLSFRADAYAGKVKLLPPLRTDQMSFSPDGQLMMGQTPEKLSGPAVGIYELVKLSRSEDLKRIFNPNKGKKRGYDSDDTAQVLVGVHKAIQVAMSDDRTKKGLKDRLKREQYGGEMWGGGNTVQTMSHWSTVPGTGAPADPRRRAAAFSKNKGIPGYSEGDTFVDANGKESKKHTFGTRGILSVRKW